jgi:hypothetical protein
LDSSLTHYTASIPLLKELTPLFLKRKGFPDRLLANSEDGLIRLNAIKALAWFRRG